MSRIIGLLGPLSAMVAVTLGAFGSHGLRGQLDDYLLGIYQTAVQYHFYHALGLTLIALALRHQPLNRLLQWSGSLMFAGTLLFSGSLYLLALTGSRWLGMITPMGGLLFIVSWLLFAVALYRSPDLDDRA
ncbi:MAG: DUF423 domain-containing protein [Gammaproteobacteria bacterium]